MSDRIVLRDARDDEAAELARVSWRAFHEGTVDGWTAYYRDNVHLRPDATVVAEQDGAIAGCASALRFVMSLAGADVPMRGVAAVAVLPEARRRGVADALLRELLRRMRRRGDALSLLMPWRMSFYRKFGYELVEAQDLLKVAPARLPPSPLRRRVRPFDVARDGAAVKALYERTRAGTTGLLARSDYWWEERIWKRAPEGAVYVDPASGRITGALHAEVPAAPAYPGQHLVVRDLVAASPEAFRGLLGHLEAQGEQIAKVHLTLRRGEGVALLRDFDPEEPAVGARARNLAGYLTLGAMARLVDVAKAFALHPGPARSGARGRLGLDLEDPVFPAQSRAFDVAISARGASIAPGKVARERLALGVDRLAQVYFDAASARTLLAQGLVTGSARAAELLDEAFAGPPPFLGPGNFF